MNFIKSANVYNLEAERLYYRVLISLESSGKNNELIEEALKIFAQAKKRKGKFRDTMNELRKR